jgi:hypothetical protein
MAGFYDPAMFLLYLRTAHAELNFLNTQFVWAIFLLFSN